MWHNITHRLGILWGRYLGWQHTRTKHKHWKVEGQDD